MRKAKVADDVRRRFRAQMKEMAGILENGTTKTGCDPGWDFMMLVDQSVGMSLRIFGLENATLILHSVSTQFEKVKEFPLHISPEKRIFDIGWIAEVDNDAHYVATGMTRERFRQIQTNLREGEEEKHAYHNHTQSLFDYVRWVLYAIEDHFPSRRDLVASALTRFESIAARFGSHLLSRRVATRQEIERRLRVEENDRMELLHGRGVGHLQAMLGDEALDTEDEDGDESEDGEEMTDGIPPRESFFVR
eukprot:jgi/Mesvir1/13646/Mv21244-RA.1